MFQAENINFMRRNINESKEGIFSKSVSLRLKNKNKCFSI